MENSLIEIRLASIEDLAQLADLVRQELECQEQFTESFQLAPEIDWLEYVAAKLGQNATRFLVAESDNRLVGFIEHRCACRGDFGSGNRLKRWLKRVLRPGNREPLPPVRPRQYGYIEDIFVAPSARSRGVASRLTQAALAWFAELGIHQVEAAVWSPNRPSLSMFEKLGFQQVRILVSKSV